MTQQLIDLLASRVSPPIQELAEPGPTDRQIEQMIAVACRVPDHGRLVPWRFVLFRGDARVRVGELLTELAESREGPLKENRRAQELSRFSRAPLVIGVVCSPKPNPKIPEWEMFLSAGAAAMNLLNAAHALGFGANWITNWYSDVPEGRALLGLAPHERVVGFVHIGSHGGSVPDRPRPAFAEVVTEWAEPKA